MSSSIGRWIYLGKDSEPDDARNNKYKHNYNNNNKSVNTNTTKGRYCNDSINNDVTRTKANTQVQKSDQEYLFCSKKMYINVDKSCTFVFF